jgi:hypothetical protein
MKPFLLLVLPLLSAYSLSLDSSLLAARPAAAHQTMIAAPKFAYAELVSQTNYGIDKYWVNGSAVPEELRKAVGASKLRVWALEYMGDEGWELVGTNSRNFDGGFEVYFYFKKLLP